MGDSPSPRVPNPPISACHVSLPAGSPSLTVKWRDVQKAYGGRTEGVRKPAGFRAAAAGGLAGAAVSCCLHPLDTAKTLLQSRRGSGRAGLQALAAFVRETGPGGLYKGLGANLVTAAPISAIYTSTYEAVKGALLPRLPKEWTAVAHCVAGGAASVATSAVYTPSEAVKQRMQLGTTLYKTSWEALIGIARTEGVSSLYKGLGAVLCRNVPQSVIKFWTYEALKHRALKDKAANERMTPVTQLLIGGAAGSTAAFFTTPFDVIKTRLQTQAAGGVQYTGVADAFLRIAVEEGVGGLYRGLLPRLMIYVSQGAIFFSSYELLKRLLVESSWQVPSSNPAAGTPRSLSSANNNSSEMPVPKLGKLGIS